ncbi:SPOR domain-containing protein [Rhizobium sp. RM]|uniref:SPOR domain-containing protein n=1 Tax=Rhizobium sp. RM TaxID=2748079 RepID=UPI00110DF828|nr:SPOR domain-containing protein [Rhizobium sp. RM]NWJ26342.1 SPOR domain-containing protein [Rhizobium sp. RM]TMV19838.1 SPOR domain-containing protein [Rhizobium sp. Td3]
MVEKNVAYNRGNRSEEFADNDPLAELARIVGFEDRPSHVTSQATQSAASPDVRREPEFNLEDELLREFEVYDAPSADPVVLDPANDVRGGIHAGDFMQRVESVFARREPEFAPVEEPQVREEPLPGAEFAYAQQDEGAHAFDIRNDFRDDAGAVAEVFDVQPREPQPVAYEEPVYEQAAWQPEPSFEPQQAEWHEMPALPADISSSAQPYAHAEVAQVPTFDLADEVEQAVAAEAPVTPAPVQPHVAPSVRAPSQVGRSSLEFSGLRLPLANFGARRDVPAAEPRRVEARVEPTPATVQAQDAAATFAPVAEVAATPSADQLSPMDELIYDVAKYSIPTRAPEAPAAQEPVAAAPVRREPVVEAVAPKPVEAPVMADFDGFNDDDFELALDDLDLDLDLSEIASIDVVSEPQPVAAAPAPVVAAQPKPAPVAPPIPVRVATPPAQRPATVTVAAAPVVANASRVAAPAPVVAAPAPVAVAPAPRPAAPVAAAPAPHVAEPASLESLPFDPSQIGETEEHPETITEMDVPELPVAAFEPKPVRRQEEDLDIDTELAALFAPAVTGGLDRHKHAEARGNAQQARPAAPAPQDVDEFERALEEDFRRSMQEASVSRGNQMQDDGYADHQAAYRGEEERSGRRWLMPVAAAVGLVLIGGGVYALMFGGSSSTGSGGAPVIISADNDPTKVVPENPGGRVVPNQDKAVYDRVAGGSAADPKQPSLISSSEEPVDVVQRTLIPEQLPLEGENDGEMEAAGTPVGETEDPRLLSPQEKAAQTETAATPGVSPRKVRTMIVKPDGTLVAQEIDAPAAQQPAADKVAELAPPPVNNAGEGAPAVIAASRVAVTPEPAQPHTPAATTAPAANQNGAPVPAARPSAQPSNVVATVTNQGNVRPTTPATPAQPQATQQTAAATPAVTNTASSGGYYVQVASLPSQAEAQKSYQSLSAKFGSVIGGRGVDIKAAEIAGKGTFYRVRIPAGDKNEAVALCERYRAAGGSCLVAR